MSPRPRTVSDADILAAAAQVMTRVGPGRLTLALVARKAGLSPATLVQRFGSKLGLLRAAAKGWVGHVPTQLEQFRRRHQSPLAALRAYLICFAAMARTPRELAHHLGYLQLDLTDPGLSRLMKEGTLLTERGIRGFVEEAVAAGELERCEPGQLARTLLLVMNGALLNAAVYREGSAEAWMAREVDAVLAPYRPVPLTTG
jgi:AcrR family transcriptional regulator